MNSDWNATSNYNRRFIGVVSKPLIFNRVLTSAERTLLFNSGYKYLDANRIAFGVMQSDGQERFAISPNDYAIDTKYKVVGKLDPDAGEITLNIDGTDVATQTYDSTLLTGANSPTFGGYDADSFPNEFVVGMPVVATRAFTTVELTMLADGMYPMSTKTVWNTTTKEISIAAGGTLQTKRLSLGTAFQYVTVNLETFTGTIDSVEISADSGATWQTVSLYTRTLITTATTGSFLLRVTASTDVVLKNTYTTELAYSNPAIQVVLEQ